tara:strand:+ start:54681 stop:54902 length:222 start_codon:yes stop_codon:yes gene_type:complete
LQYYAQKEEINILDKSSSISCELDIVYKDIYRVFLTSDGMRNGKGNENSCAVQDPSLIKFNPKENTINEQKNK